MRNFAAVVVMLAVTAPAWGVDLQSVPVITGLNQPTFVTSAPGDASLLYVLEKGGGGSASIKVFNTNTQQLSNFLTINGVETGSEMGLLGLAFDPNYASNGRFYVHYSTPGGSFGSGVTNIVEYQATSPTQANPTPIGTLLTIDQPAGNHKGGWIGFSPRAGDENNLYIALGDGGNSANSQSLQSLMGKVLRINVNPANATYTIPASNPFANSADPTVEKEIFTYGLRNPYRSSFDPVTGTLYIGDVGGGSREEINVQLPTNPGGGENYGWPLREGSITPPSVDYVDPILDYARAPGVTTLAGRTIIGGYVYRGSAIPDLVGTYIFGDYLGPEGDGARTEIFSLKFDGTTVSQVTDLTAMLNPGTSPLIDNISSFGTDAAGEIYIVDISAGTVFKIVAVPEPAALALLGAGSILLLTRRRIARVS